MGCAKQKSVGSVLERESSTKTTRHSTYSRQRQSSILGELCLHPCGKAWPCVCVCVRLCLCVCACASCVYTTKLKDTSTKVLTRGRKETAAQRDTHASCHRTTRSSPTLRVPWHKAAAAPESGGALRRLSINQGDTHASCHRATRSSPTLRVPWHKAAAAPESGGALRRLSINQGDTRASCHRATRSSPTLRVPWRSPRKQRSLAKAQRQSS